MLDKSLNPPHAEATLSCVAGSDASVQVYRTCCSSDALSPLFTLATRVTVCFYPTGSTHLVKLCSCDSTLC